MPIHKFIHEDLDYWYDKGYIITVKDKEGREIAQIGQVI